jgi:hypothetical protein
MVLPGSLGRQARVPWQKRPLLGLRGYSVRRSNLPIPLRVNGATGSAVRVVLLWPGCSGPRKRPVRLDRAPLPNIREREGVWGILPIQSSWIG